MISRNWIVKNYLTIPIIGIIFGLIGCRSAPMVETTSTPTALSSTTYPPSLATADATRISLARPSTATATSQATATGFTGVIPTQMTAQINPTNSVSSTPSPTNEPVILFSNTNSIEHIVQGGETLNSLANLYDISLADILSANGMRQADIIFTGQTLNVPIPIPTSTPTAIPDFTDQTVALEYFFQNQRPTPLPNGVNTLTYDDFLYLPASVADNIRDIFNRGQSLGRNPQVFTRIGDSTIEAPHFFFRFDDEPYHLGDYTYLQRTINYYSGSFNHDSMAVMRGLHTWSVFDPMWSPSECETGEHMLACEFRLYNPSIIFIRLGTNDRGQEDLTRENFEDIVSYCIVNGVIPILGTKADRFDGDNSTNAIIREIAESYDLPLWDFDLLAQALPNHGLNQDDVHLSFFYEHDWRLARGFTTGHGLHNLTGLIVLDEIRQVLNHD